MASGNRTNERILAGIAVGPFRPPSVKAQAASTTKAGVFDELTEGVRTLLTEHATFHVDRKAGLLQVTDFPERLDRVSVYLDAVQDRVHRQVQIDARVIEVEANDEKAAGVDWTVVAAELSGTRTPAQRASRRALQLLQVRNGDCAERSVGHRLTPSAAG